MLTLDELVANGTITPSGADVLRDIGQHGESFLVYSLPRSAGKSTIVAAILHEADGIPRHDFLGTQDEVDSLTAASADGYVVVAEMGHRGQPGYLAGEEIERAFDLAAHGFHLASSLHADTAEQVFEVFERNGIDRRTVARARYLVKVQPHGDPFDPATQRTVDHVHELFVDGDDVSAVVRYDATTA